jgi:DNA-binding transcriptional MerR regulator
MGRGMNLSEFREALSSEATIENENLKKELEDLKKSSSEKIKDLEEQLEDVKKHRKFLSNRCYVLTKGMMCHCCDISYPDCKYAVTWEDEEAMSNFIHKNKLDIHDPATHCKVAEFLQKRRAKRFGI